MMMESPLVSQIVVAYNEARFVESSLVAIDKSLTTPHELVFVDDLSTDNTLSIVLKLAESMPNLKVHGNVTRLGVSGSRRLAYEKYVDDNAQFIQYFDAHVWPDAGCMDALVQDAYENHAIIVPAFTIISLENFESLSPLVLPKRFHTNFGSGLSFDTKRFWYYLSVSRKTPELQLTPRTAFHAPGCTMTRAVHDYLDGWNTLPGFWGGNDILFSIKNFMMDVPILSDPQAFLFHFAKKFSERNMPVEHQAFNRVLGARLTFSEETFNEFWLPEFKERYEARLNDAEFAKLLNSENVIQTRNKIRERYCHTDAEFITKFVPKECWQ